MSGAGSEGAGPGVGGGGGGGTRSGLAIRGYLSTLAFTGVTVLVGLWSNRVLVPTLGRERFGAARALLDWWMHLGMLDFGINGTAAPLLARATSRGRLGETRALFGLATRLCAGVGCLISLAALGLYGVLDWLVAAPEELREELRWGWLLLTPAAFAVMAGPPRAYLEARQLGWRVNVYLTIQAVGIVGLSVEFARRGWGVPGQTLAYLIGMYGFAAAVGWDAGRRLRNLERDLGMGSGSGSGGKSKEEEEAEGRAARDAAWGDIKRVGPATALLTFSGRVSVMNDMAVISALLGTGSVTVWFLTVRLPSLAQGQLQAVSASSWAGLAQLEHQGRRDLFGKRLLELTRLTTILGVAALAPIAAYDGHFVRLWMRDETLFAGRGAAALASLNALGMAYWMLWGWCFTGTGRARRVVAPSCVGAAVNLGLSLALTPRLGVNGPMAATALCLFGFQLGWLANLLRRDFGIPAAGLGRAAGIPLAAGVPLLGLCAWGAESGEPGWAGLAAEMSLAAGGYLVFAWFALLTGEERGAWRARLGIRGRGAR